jgi:hypothetical protein
MSVRTKSIVVVNALLAFWLTAFCPSTTYSQSASDTKINTDIVRADDEALIQTSVHPTYPMTLLFYRSKINELSVTKVKLKIDASDIVYDLFTIVGDGFSPNFSSLWSPDGRYLIYVRSIHGGLGFYRSSDLFQASRKKGFTSDQFFKRTEPVDLINILSDKLNPQYFLSPVEWTDRQSLIFSVTTRVKNPRVPDWDYLQLGHYRYDLPQRKLYRLIPSEPSADSARIQILFKRMLAQNKAKTFRSTEIGDEALLKPTRRQN